MKDRLNILAGFLPLCTMAMLLISKSLLESGTIPKTWQTVMAIQIFVFLVPTVVGCTVSRKLFKKLPIPCKSISVREIIFTLFSGLAISLLGFWANFTVISALKISSDSGQFSVPGAPWWVVLLISILIPAVFEEILFRGAMQSALAEYGTAVSIIAPAVCFSLIHIDIANIAGSFIAGLLCGYLTYSFGSIIPAVLVHIIYNSYYLIMDFLVDTYEVFGLVPYFFVTNIFLFLIFSYFALRVLEKLILSDRVKRFEKSSIGNLIKSILGSPGVVILLLITIMTIAYSV